MTLDRTTITTILLLLITTIAIFINGEQLQVFILPHSHVDPGWLKSKDGYKSEVFHILNNVISSIRNEKHRKFVWNDVLYFKEWFETQNFEMQHTVQNLISSGRFEIVGGGWVQNDEACPSYSAIIDQMTLGHQYLLERFGVRIRVGWQIDPFGHDGRVARIFADMGLDALVINRVHHRIKAQMKQQKALEFLWRFPTYTGVNHTEIFTHTLHTHYSAPFGFDFENSGVQRITSSSVGSRAEQLVAELKRRADDFKTPHLLITFGDDFKFKNADLQFSNMDQLIDHINANYGGSVRIKYGTAAEYFDTVFEYSKNTKFEGFPVVKQDFVPYADNDDSYWTGYYSSLPNLKKRARDAEGSLNAAERLALLTRIAENVLPSASKLNWIDVFSELQHSREAVALIQHHDSITGTCRKEVYNYYINILSNINTSNNRIQNLMTGTLLSQKLDESNPSFLLRDAVDEVLDPGKLYGIVVYNPDSDERLRIIRVRSTAPYAVVKDLNGHTIPAQSVPVLVDNNGNWVKKQMYDIFFAVTMPGVSIQKITILPHGTTEKQEHTQTYNTIYFASGADENPKTVKVSESVQKKTLSNNDDISIENNHYIVTLDPKSGYIQKITEKESGTVHVLPQQLMEYESERSGSYIFRTNKAARPLTNQQLEYIHITKGDLFQQAFITTSRVTIVIRLPQTNSDDVSADYIQMNYDVHELPVNTEMVTRFSVKGDKSTPQLLVYDGKDIVKRKVHSDAPLPGHFYPSQAGAILMYPDTQLTVLTGHTMGLTTWNNELEFVIHRRLGKDDGRGMSQANDDFSTLVVPFFFKLKTKKGFSARSITRMHATSHTINLPFSIYITREPHRFNPDFHVLNSKYHSSNTTTYTHHIIQFR
jgi:alpha-mannosidase II